MSKNDLDEMRDLVEIANEIKSFYESAVAAVENPVVKAELLRLAKAQDDLIKVLSEDRLLEQFDWRVSSDMLDFGSRMGVVCINLEDKEANSGVIPIV